MSSEKTFTQKEVDEVVEKAIKQTNTFGSRVSMGLSAADVPPELMKFYIDNPGAMNNRCKAFSTRPTCVIGIGKVAGPAFDVTAYLTTFFDRTFDVFVIDNHKVNNSSDIFPSELGDNVDVVVVDRMFANIAIANLGNRVMKLDSIIIVGKEGPGLTVGYPGEAGLFVYEDWKGAAKHFAELRCKKVSDEIAAVLTKLKAKLKVDIAD